MALACACVSCQEVARHPNGDLSLEAYDSLREEAYTLHPTKVRDHIRHLAARAKGQHSEDAYICDYYSAGAEYAELKHAEHYAHEIIGR